MQNFSVGDMIKTATGEARYCVIAVSAEGDRVQVFDIEDNTTQMFLASEIQHVTLDGKKVTCPLKISLDIDIDESSISCVMNLENKTIASHKTLVFGTHHIQLAHALLNSMTTLYTYSS